MLFTLEESLPRAVKIFLLLTANPASRVTVDNAR